MELDVYSGASFVAQLDPVIRLTKDIKQSARVLTDREARYLVDAYYQIQDYRIAAHGQERAADKAEEPCELVSWLGNQMEILENQIKRALDTYSSASLVGEWAKEVVGIGPVLAAGLLAHINAEEDRHVSGVWRFAGQDPTIEWKPKTKRPWNADLKVLCWKIGESFVKVCNKEGAIYGKLYATRKEREAYANENLKYFEQAKAKLAKYNIGKDTEAYKYYSIGKLPPAHIHARAKRFAVKRFLSHFYTVAYYVKFGKLPSKPYVIEYLGHKDYEPVPHTYCIPGLKELEKKMYA